MEVIPKEMGTSNTEVQRNARNKNLRGAFVTSLVARGAGILLQVLSLPVAAAALGAEGFVAYSMVSATLAWLTLSNIGIGQATTLHIARNTDPYSRNELLTASLISTFTISISAVALTAFLAISNEFVPRIFSVLIPNLHEIYLSLAFIALVFLITQNLSVFEAAQLACQRQDRLNLALSVGSTLAAIAVYVVAKQAPTVLHILLAVHVPVLVMRVVNAVGVAKVFEIKIANFSSVRWKSIHELLRDGFSFLSGSTLSNFLCHPFSIIVVGATATAITSASFAAVMNAVILASSLFGLVMTPFRGALPEAAKRSDSEWIKRAYFLALKVSFFYALVPCILLSVFGQKVFEIWYRGTIFPPKLILIPAGAYVICLAIEVVNYNFLSSLGRLKSASQWLLSKSIVGAVLTWILVRNDHAELVFWVLVAASVVFSLIPLSLMINRLVNAAQGTNYA